MARIRTIKPEFFTSEQVVSLSPLARLLFIALWCEADREGRLAWKPLTFKLRYFPGDDCDITALCRQVIDADLVRLYDQGRLAYIPSFGRHQYINPRETPSTLPSPEDTTDASVTRPHASVTHREELKEGKEGETRHDATGRRPQTIVQGQRQNVAIPWRVKLPGELWAEWRTRLAVEAYGGDEAAAERALHTWAMGVVAEWDKKPTGGDDSFTFWRARFAEWRGTTKRAASLPADPPAPRIPKAREVLAAQGIPVPARKVVAS